MMQLTDLEICTRIAEIEDISFHVTQYRENNFVALLSTNDFTGTPPELIGEFNPLTDDALCFQLMVKDKIRLVYEYDGTWICFSNDTTNKLLSKSSNPNRAVCLAKIELNK